MKELSIHQRNLYVLVSDDSSWVTGLAVLADDGVNAGVYKLIL